MREKLAKLAHEQWSGWMVYLFSKCRAGEHGVLIIPAWAVDRWTRQMNTAYSDLRPEEKDSDRAEADKFLAVINREAKEGPTMSKFKTIKVVLIALACFAPGIVMLDYTVAPSWVCGLTFFWGGIIFAHTLLTISGKLK